MVAAARAGETGRENPLIRDPYARLLVSGAGTGIWESLLDNSFAERAARSMPRRPRSSSTWAASGCPHALLRRVLREGLGGRIARSSSLKPRASIRAYRLDWPAGTTVYEIDQPKVLEYKAATDHGAQPAALRRGFRSICGSTGPKSVAGKTRF